MARFCQTGIIVVVVVCQGSSGVRGEGGSPDILRLNLISENAARFRLKDE